MAIIPKGGGGKPEEEKTVTAGTSVIEVHPTSGKTMKKVTVNPTPTEEKTVTPTTSQQTVSPSNGKHLAKVIVEAIEDVTPEVTAQTPIITQIAENLGVTITTPSGSNKQILQGNNENLQSINQNITPKDAETIIPGTSEQLIPAKTFLRGDLIIAGDSALIPANIREGVNIYGVTGTLTEGTKVWSEIGTFSGFNAYWGNTITTSNSGPKRIFGGGTQHYSPIGKSEVMILNGTTVTIGGTENGDETASITFETNSVKIPNTKSFLGMSGTVSYCITNAEI